MRSFILAGAVFSAALTMTAAPAHAQRATAQPIARPVAEAQTTVPATTSPTGPQAAAAVPPATPPGAARSR